MTTELKEVNDELCERKVPVSETDDGEMNTESATPERNTLAPVLSDEDQVHLRTYEGQCVLLKDRVNSVAQKYHNGLYLTGRPGSGKTHLVRETLKHQGVAHVYRNGRMTAMGLYDELAEHSETVLVIDDIPNLLNDKQAVQILLAALGGEPGRSRPITCAVRNQGDRPVEFEYSGGLIVISNVPLRSDPLAKALSSRTTQLEHEPTDAELAAVMRSMALKGHEGMDPGKCQEVVEFIIKESASNAFRLDLRCVRRGWQDYRQSSNGHAVCDWENLIRSSMRQIVTAEAPKILSRPERRVRDIEAVRAAMKLHPEDTTSQMEAAGFKHSKFYELRALVLATGA